MTPQENIAAARRELREIFPDHTHWSEDTWRVMISCLLMTKLFGEVHAK